VVTNASRERTSLVSITFTLLITITTSAEKVTTVIMHLHKWRLSALSENTCQESVLKHYLTVSNVNLVMSAKTLVLRLQQRAHQVCSARKVPLPQPLSAKLEAIAQPRQKCNLIANTVK
jgi:hypothetical protein